MNPRQMFSRARAVFAPLFLLAASGCVTMQNRDDTLQQQQQQLALQQSIDRLKVQTETLLAQQDQIQQQLQQMRAVPQDRVTSSEFQQLQSQMQSRIAELERKIAAVDSARAQDKQEIVNTLSKNVSTAMAQMNRQTAATTKTSGGGTKTGTTKTGGGTSTSSAGPQKMFEHVVAAGDTLSAIATAYHSTTAAIIAANNLKNPQNLKVGQKLLIPAQ